MAEKESEVTRNIEEQLSAFLDGELPADELQMLVRRLEKDPAHRATLARYVYVGSVLRNEPAGLPGADMRSRVMREVDGMERPVAEPPSRQRRQVSSWPSLSVAAMIAFAAIGLSQLMPEKTGSAVVKLPVAADQRVIAASKPRVAAVPNVMARDKLTSYMVSHGEFSRSWQGTAVDSRVFARPASYRYED